MRAHFEFNRNRPDLSQDWNENKHYFIARRSLKAGGRRDIFLGTRECQAYVEPVDFDSGEGAYDDMDMDFGLQYHSIGYPDETGENQMIVRFWYPRMEKGRIKCCTGGMSKRTCCQKGFYEAVFSGSELFVCAGGDVADGDDGLIVSYL